MELRAFAKVNLSLDVLGKRADGYHDVKMIMQSIGIFDTITIEHAKTPGITLSASSPSIPTDSSNLVWKAADTLTEYAAKRYADSDSSIYNYKSAPHGIHIYIQKEIPHGAGMGGGSADAAATLIGLNKLFSYGFSDEELCAVGKSVGADVPFCLKGGTCMAEGIGEVLTPLSFWGEYYLLIAKPDIHVSTADIYRSLQLTSDSFHPDVNKMTSAILNHDLFSIANALGNKLAEVTEEMHPVISEIRDFLSKSKALGSLMSGSGPTVFAIYDTKAAALYDLENLHMHFDFQYGNVVSPVPHGVEITSVI